MPAGSKQGRMAGFTLLELLVALAMASMILMGVYRVVDGAANGQRFLEKRQEQLHLWMHVRRLLRRDLEHRLTFSDADLVLGAVEGVTERSTSVTLHGTGGVVPGHLLGPVVDVHYTWEETPDGAGVIWMRAVRVPDSERKPSGLNLRISEGLEAVAFSVLDKSGWKDLEDEMEPPLRAVRWQFRWSILGSWTLVLALTP